MSDDNENLTSTKGTENIVIGSNTKPLKKRKKRPYLRHYNEDHNKPTENADRPRLFETKSNTKYHSHLLEKQEESAFKALDYAHRCESLLLEQPGHVDLDDESVDLSKLTQHEIQNAVDITSAQKFFELDLNQFGPYRMNYTRNGRFLVLGGRKGHIAAFDWQTKRLLCEMNVMESVNDVKWLHQETLFSVAQKQWTYIYDNQGIELHCLKNLDRVLRLEFLPYHFLLAASNTTGYLTYVDVSVGQKIAGFSTHMGRLDVMSQNPSNAIICLGHSGGTVTMWSPNIKEPLVKMLCHGGGVRSIAVEPTGRYMASSGIDRCLRIWDLRTYKLFNSYRIQNGAGQLSFSQTGFLAAGIRNIVEIYDGVCNEVVSKPYLSHICKSQVHSLQFCPYEDVLGVGYMKGFSSLIVPGSGEPNFDATESNPYQTKKQRQEMEVRQLLEKIQPEMITLDTTLLGKIEAKSVEEIHLKKQQRLAQNETRQKLKTSKKAKGPGRTQIAQDLQNRLLRRSKLHKKDNSIKTAKDETNVLHRFKRKDV